MTSTAAPSTHPLTHVRQVTEMIFQKASHLEARLRTLVSFAEQEIEKPVEPDLRAVLSLGHETRRTYKQVQRVMTLLAGVEPLLPVEKPTAVLLYRRMLMLEAERLAALRSRADHLSLSIQKKRRGLHSLSRPVVSCFPPLVETKTIQPSPMFDFVAPSSWKGLSKIGAQSRRMIISFQKWLAHPLIDTRHPSEPVP